jgi:hypothetical protein
MTTDDLCIHDLPTFSCAICLHGPARNIEPEITECPKCGAEVIWGVDPLTGRRNPLDVEPDNDVGYINMVMVYGQRMPELTYVPTGTGQYVSHLSTCPAR